MILGGFAFQFFFLPEPVQFTDDAIDSYVEDLEGRLERMEKLMNTVS